MITHLLWWITSKFTIVKKKLENLNAKAEYYGFLIIAVSQGFQKKKFVTFNFENKQIMHKLKIGSVTYPYFKLNWAPFIKRWNYKDKKKLKKILLRADNNLSTYIDISVSETIYSSASKEDYMGFKNNFIQPGFVLGVDMQALEYLKDTSETWRASTGGH